MLYPRQDRDLRRLTFRCRNCGQSEEVEENCIYVNELVKDTLDVLPGDIIDDPTLQRDYDVTCPMCSHNGAVFIRSHDGVKQVTLGLIWVMSMGWLQDTILRRARLSLPDPTFRFVEGTGGLPQVELIDPQKRVAMKANVPGAAQRGPNTIAVKSIGQKSNAAGSDSSAPPPSAASSPGKPSKPAPGKNPHKFPLNQVVRVLRRLLTIAAAVVYIWISLTACLQSLDVLSTSMTPPIDYSSYDSVLLAEAAGSKMIRESPIVMEMLGDDTSPRNGTLFLDNNTTGLTYFTAGCDNIAKSVIYQDTFQRFMFATVVSSLAYNLTFLDPLVSELITPIVDCTLTSLVIGDMTEPKLFYLMRQVADPNDVHLLTVSIGVQEYQVPKIKSAGPAAISTITFINDMRATEITHHFAAALGFPYKDPVFQIYENIGLTNDGSWLLKSVPKNPKAEASKIISTSTPTGSYLSSTNEQSTLVNLIWRLSQDPKTMLAHWVWYGKTVVRDSWGWVHLLHLYYAVSAIISLLVLLVVMYYNLRLGKIWVGDAFVSISSAHAVRSSLVIVSWIMNKYWALMEFALYSGNELGDSRAGILSSGIMRADLLSLYLSLVGLIGAAFKERIDPALTLVLFSIGYEARLAITKWSPGMVKTLTAFADLEYILGVTPLDPSIPVRYPLHVWNCHPLPTASASVVLSALFPVFSTLVFLPVYVAIRKIYRRVRPDLVSSQRSSANSTKESDSTHSRLTQFEFATGVALRESFGVVSDYDNYVYIKGMKFASADGIYTSGFVIANGKFLIQVVDLQAILLMKLSQIRFKNVYVYEVEGNSVKQTARLVYPETITFRDILHLNLRILL